MRVTHEERSLIGDWWRTIDRALLAVALVLLATGIVVSLAASPEVATRKGLATYHFVERHLAFAALGCGVLLVASMLETSRVMMLAGLILATTFCLMILAILVGPEINGAHRWLRIAGLSLQPSEIAKPAFVVVTAWLLAAARRAPATPALPTALLLYSAMTMVLLLQPDVGQWLLISVVWGLLFWLSGQPVRWLLAFGGIGIAGMSVAYLTLPHVRGRIVRYLDPAAGDTYQTDRAIQSIAEGGLFGRGPGEGTIKAILPDAHTDFILAVIAEEYGAIACLMLLALYAFLVARALATARTKSDTFVSLSIIGLAVMVGLQAAINIAVNVGLVPAKGMTLPFISAGGSSLVSVSLSVGFLLALTRRRADPRRVKKPTFRTYLGLAGQRGPE